MSETAPIHISKNMNLAPARWIWLPSQRTLPNTFVLFRREVDVQADLQSATGWLTADSRYRFTVNGRRVQWGPAPCDPRHQEVDPFDITPHLTPGRNVLGVEVLYYGTGDGTWALGAPGFLFQLQLQYSGGARQQIVSDPDWLTYLDRAHPPGQPKRWFLRALQEEFDARLHPHGWNEADYAPDDAWLPAQLLPGSATTPAAFAGGPEYVLQCDAGADLTQPQLRARSIPMLREFSVPVQRLAQSGRVVWKRDPRDWFESRIPNSFEITREPLAQNCGEGWSLPATPDGEGIFATFEFEEQIVGWPHFTVDAPAGTIIELMTQEPSSN